MLSIAESLAVARRRELTRKSLQSVLQEEAREGEKKGAPARSCACGGTGKHRGTERSRVLTATGQVTLRRVYLVCFRTGCGIGGHGADLRLGVQGGAQARQAERLLCLAGASWSFAKSSTVSEGVLRPERVGQYRAGASVSTKQVPEIEAWQAHRSGSRAALSRNARRDVEFETDGTCVNTTAGWKEMRVGVFAKREFGPAGMPRRVEDPQASRARCSCGVCGH